MISQSRKAAGDRVKITLLPDGRVLYDPELAARYAAEASDPRGLAEIIAAVAALPNEAPDDGFSGRDHDKVLYGNHGAR